MKKQIIIPIAILIATWIKAQVPSNDPSWILTSIGSDDFTGALTNYSFSGDWRNVWCYCNAGTPVSIDVKDCKRVNNPIFVGPDAQGNSFILLETKKQNNVVTQPNYCNSNYTSCAPVNNVTGTKTYISQGYLTSNKLFKYGYFELRARLPFIPSNLTSSGLAANFWLKSWVSGNEIDVFEFRGESNTNGFHKWGGNSHYNAGSTVISDPSQVMTLSEPITNNWHKWALEWGPNSLKYYFDGALVYTSYNHAAEMDLQQIILDVNVGNFVSPNVTTVDPYNYEIDYIHIYGLNTSQLNNCYINNSGPNFNSISNSVYQCVELGNGTISSSSGKEQNIRATNYIQLGPGFILNSGTPFYAECMSNPAQQTN